MTYFQILTLFLTGLGHINQTLYILRGKKNVEHGDDKNGKWKKETFISDDGTYQVTNVISIYG